MKYYKEMLHRCVYGIWDEVTPLEQVRKHLVFAIDRTVWEPVQNIVPRISEQISNEFLKKP